MKKERLEEILSKVWMRDWSADDALGAIWGEPFEGHTISIPTRPIKAIELIAAERNRQIAVEGFTPAHEDKHDKNQLANAAACYALDCRLSEKEIWDKPLLDYLWPWKPEWWKPEQSRVRNLVKSGALIVAEIERLQRIEADWRENPAHRDAAPERAEKTRRGT